MCARPPARTTAKTLRTQRNQRHPRFDFDLVSVSDRGFRQFPVRAAGFPFPLRAAGFRCPQRLVARPTVESLVGETRPLCARSVADVDLVVRRGSMVPSIDRSTDGTLIVAAAPVDIGKSFPNQQTGPRCLPDALARRRSWDLPELGSRGLEARLPCRSLISGLKRVREAYIVDLPGVGRASGWDGAGLEIGTLAEASAGGAAVRYSGCGGGGGGALLACCRRFEGFCSV